MIFVRKDSFPVGPVRKKENIKKNVPDNEPRIHSYERIPGIWNESIAKSAILYKKNGVLC